VKRRTGLGVAVGLVAALAFPGASAAAFTGLTNGSFEDVNATYVDGGSGFEQLNAVDSTTIDGWSVDAGSVDWIGTYWPAADPDMSIDLSGVSAGTLSQTFATTIGNTYTVTFALSGNPAGPPTVKRLDVSATGGTLQSYTYDTVANGNDLTDMKWTTATYTFLATSASTTLSFISTTDGAFGPAIDNVVVTESVPEKNDCKNGGWQTMIDNAGNTFKNQGDCVSYFATKGKNVAAGAPLVTAGAATESTSAAIKHATKHVDKVTARTERHATKVKANSHSSHGHGAKTHKTK
jgi:choice-of-anchor C domain-containing protein